MKSWRSLVLVGLIAGVSPAEAGPPRAEAQPNVTVHVSGSLLNALVRQPVDRIEQVDEEILGTQYYGQSRMCGQVRVELFPDPCRAALDLIVGGVTYSRAAGYRGSIVVQTRTAFPFEVRKRIAIDSKQILADPAHASVRAESEILAVTNLLGEERSLAVLLARARAAQEKGDTEAVAASRAQRRLAAQLDEEVHPQLARAVRSLAEGLNLARRLGLSPRPFEWSTAPDKVHLRITVPAPSQPASTSPPPPPRSADLTAGVHQSLLNEAAHTAVAGKTFTIFQLMDMLRDSLLPGLSGEELAKFPSTEDLAKLLKDLGVAPPTVLFAERQPVTLTAASQQVSVALRGLRVKECGAVSPAVDIKAAYKIEKTAAGFALVRQGPVLVLSSKEAKTEADLITRTRLQLSFTLLFTDRLILAAVPLPAAQDVQAKRLVPMQVTVEDGWMQYSWMLQGAWFKHR